MLRRVSISGKLCPRIWPIAQDVNLEVVKEVQVIEGAGGVGTILLFSLRSSGGFQKERISELDAVSHEIGREVVEGGYLNRGFSHFKPTFRLSGKPEHQTLVNQDLL